MEKTVVDRLYDEYKDLVSFLDRNNEISFRTLADANFRKSLLLAAASYFEHHLTSILSDFIQNESPENQLLFEFVKNKAISRQYHTYFSWNEKNANQFFGLFGDSFKTYMKDEVKNNEDLDKSIKAFLEIGQDRNRLVHQNFGTIHLEKTTKEIYELYQAALSFLESLPCKMQECISQCKSE